MRAFTSLMAVFFLWAAMVLPGAALVRGARFDAPEPSGRVLLIEVEASAQATMVLTWVDWPASFDKLELELIGVRPLTEALLTLEPVDNGTARTAAGLTLKTNFQEMRGSSHTTGQGSDWQNNRSTGKDAGDGVVGSLMIWEADGFISGAAHWAMLNDAGDVTTALHSYTITTIGTRWDGVEISWDAGEVFAGGTARLWGWSNQ